MDEPSLIKFMDKISWMDGWTSMNEFSCYFGRQNKRRSNQLSPRHRQ
jgi:hypothetical protein